MEQRKVLIVDDEPDIREILELLLNSNGYEVFSCPVFELKYSQKCSKMPRFSTTITEFYGTHFDLHVVQNPATTRFNPHD